MTCCSAARRVVGAVILDAGGVILHPDLDWIARQAEEQGLHLTRRDLFLAYYRTVHGLDLNPDLARRGLAFTDLDARCWFFVQLLGHAGAAEEQASTAGPLIARLAADTYPRESDIYHWAMPGLRDRLEGLRRAGFVLGAASNNDDALEAQLTSVGVRDLFDALKDSGREGVSKPDPELLWRAARELGIPPEHCVYVGDVDRVDGAAARAARMAFALLDPLDQPRPTRPLCIPDLDSLHLHFAAARDGVY